MSGSRANMVPTCCVSCKEWDALLEREQELEQLGWLGQLWASAQKAMLDMVERFDAHPFECLHPCF